MIAETSHKQGKEFSPIREFAKNIESPNCSALSLRRHFAYKSRRICYLLSFVCMLVRRLVRQCVCVVFSYLSTSIQSFFRANERTPSLVIFSFALIYLDIIFRIYFFFVYFFCIVLFEIFQLVFYVAEHCCHWCSIYKN